MKRTITSLRYLFFIPIVMSLILVIGCELDLIEEGIFISEDSKSTEILLMTIMELITIINIPLALRLFKFKNVAEKLKGNPDSLRTFGSMRILLLGTPLLANTTLYYLFLTSTFGYLAIILMLAMFFIYPSKSRCENEIA